MKDISKLLRVAAVVAIGIMAIGSCVNEAAARDKTDGKGADVGRTASSYRKPIRLNGIGSPHRRGSRLPKESGGMPKEGGLKSAPTQ
jgi:hypothetical protein